MMQQGDHIVLQEVQEAASSGVHCGLQDVCGSFFLVGQIQTAGGTCDLYEQGVFIQVFLIQLTGEAQ